MSGPRICPAVDVSELLLSAMVESVLPDETDIAPVVMDVDSPAKLLLTVARDNASDPSAPVARMISVANDPDKLLTVLLIDPSAPIARVISDDSDPETLLIDAVRDASALVARVTSALIEPVFAMICPA